MTAGDWAAVIVGIAAVLVGLAAIPASPVRSSIASACAVLVSIALMIGAISFFSRDVAINAGGSDVGQVGPSAATTSAPSHSTPTSSLARPGSRSPESSGPVSPQVRQQTGEQKLTLTKTYSADLDSGEFDWSVGWSPTGSMEERSKDLLNSGGFLHGKNGSDFAIVTNTSTLDKCRSATGYQKLLKGSEVDTGLNLCVRTSDARIASVAVVSIAKDSNGQMDSVSFDVTVWDSN